MPRAKPVNTKIRGRGQPHANDLIEPGKTPFGTVAVRMHDARGELWARLHLDERTWEAIERLAVRDGVTVDEVVSRAMESAFGLPDGRDQKGGAA